MPIQVQRPESWSLKAALLTPAAFAPFGIVIQNPTKTSFPYPPSSIKANQGSALKYAGISPLVSSYELARSEKPATPSMSMFSCKPRALQRTANGKQRFDVKILERHPFTPQTFVPIGLAANDRETAYLVIVAPTLPLAGGVEVENEFKSDDYRLAITSQSLPAPNPIAMATATPKPPGPPDLSNVKAFVARGDQAVTYGAGTWHAPMVVLGKQTIDFVVLQFANGVAAEDCQEAELYGGALDVLIDDDAIASSKAKL